MTEKHDGAGLGGGIFITIALLTGAGIGIYVGQPSLGILGGLATGAAAAIIHWLVRRPAG